jgi:iron complex transport system substrate-binding protein
MRGTSLANAGLLASAIIVSMVLTSVFAVQSSSMENSSASVANPSFVTDEDGVEVAVRPYDRIVSTSTIADQVLVRLIETDRLIAVSSQTLESGMTPWRYEGKAGIASARDLESIIQLRPDIVFVHGFADVRHVERMRDAGLTVFNLGEMRGLETFVDDVERIAGVVGAEERGRTLAQRLLRRLDAVKTDVAPARRERAIYVAVYGDRIFGGTVGTSFHDVLIAAGLIDAAAEAGYRGSPTFSSEQLLSLDPPWIITNAGSEEALCRRPGLRALSACVDGRVRGIDGNLVSDPGLGMLPAAEAIHDAVYGHTNSFPHGPGSEELQ